MAYQQGKLMRKLTKNHYRKKNCFHLHALLLRSHIFNVLSWLPETTLEASEPINFAVITLFWCPVKVCCKTSWTIQNTCIRKHSAQHQSSTNLLSAFHQPLSKHDRLDHLTKQELAFPVKDENDKYKSWWELIHVNG